MFILYSMEKIFGDCVSLNYLDISGFYNKKILNYTQMFLNISEGSTIRYDSKKVDLKTIFEEFPDYWNLIDINEE